MKSDDVGFGMLAASNRNRVKSITKRRECLPFPFAWGFFFHTNDIIPYLVQFLRISALNQAMKGEDVF
jgi:hypothetical protein